MTPLISLSKKPLAKFYESPVTFLKAYTPQFAYWSLANIQYIPLAKFTYSLNMYIYIKEEDWEQSPIGHPELGE